MQRLMGRKKWPHKLKNHHLPSNSGEWLRIREEARAEVGESCSMYLRLWCQLHSSASDRATMPLHGERADVAGSKGRGQGTHRSESLQVHLPPSPVPGSILLHSCSWITWEPVHPMFLDTNSSCLSLLPYSRLAKCDLRQWVSFWMSIV